MENKLKRSIIIALVLLAGAAVVGSGFLHLMSSKKQATTAVPRDVTSNEQVMKQKKNDTVSAISDSDTSNWKVYRNEKYGFEVKYPQDWELRHTYTEVGKVEIFYFDKNGQKYFVEGGEEDAIMIAVSFKDNPLLTPMEDILNIWEKAPNISVQKIIVDGSQAYYHIGSSEGVEVPDIPHKNYRFSIESGVMTTPDLEKEIRPVLQGMIQSVRFIE